jgi:hypothetical protein
LSAPGASSSYALLTTLATSTAALNNTGNGGAYTQYTLNYTAGTADAGEYLAVFLNATGGSAFAMFDDVVLTVTSLPAAPTGLTAAAGNGQVALSWGSSSNSTSYTLGRGTVSGGPYPPLASGMTTSGYLDSSVTNGTIYYYVVSASNPAGTSATSAEVSAKPYEPIAPGELTAAAISYSGPAAQLTLHSVNGRVYQLQYSNTLNPANWQNIGPALTGTGGVIILSDPAPGSAPQRFYHILIQP